MSLIQRRALVDPAHPASIRQQCQWLSLPRSSYYYQPCPASADELLLMRLLDEQHLLTPQYGYRKMTLFLRDKGHVVNHKRVLRLMQMMGLEAIYPRPNMSQPAEGHTIYPYLLRQLSIVRVHQVWATDITYVPMAEGYMYLMAIIDLFSRYVLDWSVSNTMDAEWCNGLLKKTLATYPAPVIFNTDQGSQFTSEAFTATLKAADIRISMDGKGRALDNIFVERLWRTRGRPCGKVRTSLPVCLSGWLAVRKGIKRFLYVLQPETLPPGVSLSNARSGIPSRRVSRKSSG